MCMTDVTLGIRAVAMPLPSRLWISPLTIYSITSPFQDLYYPREQRSVMEYQANVITSQPQVTVTEYTVSSGLSEWSSNVCDCCEDCGICLCATFVPCILACKVAQDNGDSCCVACLPGAMIALRTSIRSRYRISGSVCDDWIVMACLPLCGLCQMAREQKMRG